MGYEKQIWDWLKANSPFTDEGIAGLLGNFMAESNCESVRVQGDFSADRQKSKDYTDSVDIGAISATAFARDGKGYGLPQLTFWSRKLSYHAFASQRGKSIGDMETQLAFCVSELKSDFYSVYKILCESHDIRECSNAVLLQYERPADMSKKAQDTRETYADQFYTDFHYQSAKAENDVESIVTDILTAIKPIITNIVKEKLK